MPVNDTSPVVPYYFYDLNLKAITVSMHVTGYSFQVILERMFFEMSSADETFKYSYGMGQLYRHTQVEFHFLGNAYLPISPCWLANYNYSLENSLTYGKPKKESKFDWNADLLDYSFKYDIGYYYG